MSRLNRKRKASGEREADREKGKKICLERSVAKTLLTLNRHTGISKEEHAAARALLDLSLEPVESSGEDDEESTHELKEQPDEFPEPIVSHINRNTQTDDKLLRECSTQVSETLLQTEYIFLAVCTFYCHNLINKLVLLFCSLTESDFR